jgi:hypothetical protein
VKCLLCSNSSPEVRTRDSQSERCVNVIRNVHSLVTRRLCLAEGYDRATLVDDTDRAGARDTVRSVAGFAGRSVRVAKDTSELGSSVNDGLAVRTCNNVALNSPSIDQQRSLFPASTG